MFPTERRDLKVKLHDESAIQPLRTKIVWVKGLFASMRLDSEAKLWPHTHSKYPKDDEKYDLKEVPVAFIGHLEQH
jgi:hypothetical protein